MNKTNFFAFQLGNDDDNRREHISALEMSLILERRRCFWCRLAAFFFFFWFMIGVIIMLNEELLHLTCGVSGRIWGMKWRAVRNAWVTANCAYLVVIMTSLTSSGMLLSCETAVGEQISYIHLDCFWCEGCILRLKEATAVLCSIWPFPSGHPSEGTTVLLAECQRSEPCVALSLFLWQHRKMENGVNQFIRATRVAVQRGELGAW